MINNPAFMVFVRNKAPYIGSAVRSMLSQTYAPMQLIVSVQGSTDGTREIAAAEIARYNGPNKAFILDCPETAREGMPGAVAHLNWLHRQVEADYFIISSGDDISLPDRAKRTVETINSLDREPLGFSTGTYFATLAEAREGQAHGQTAYPTESKWIAPGEHLSNLVGSSGTLSYSPKVVELMGGGIPDHALQDLYVPFIAAMEDRHYFLAEMLGVYLVVPDGNNLGLQTRLTNAKTEDERAIIIEVMNAQMSANALRMAQAAEARSKAGLPNAHEHYQAGLDYFFGLAASWTQTRMNLVEKNLAPIALPGKF